MSSDVIPSVSPSANLFPFIDAAMIGITVLALVVAVAWLALDRFPAMREVKAMPQTDP